jgi:predicted RecB family nuclease
VFFLDQDLIYSASDLVTAASCEFTSLSKLDERLGRSKTAKVEADEMLERTAELGDVHEHKVLDSLLTEFGEHDPATGRGVKILQAGVRGNKDSLRKAQQETLDALNAGAPSRLGLPSKLALTS